MENSKLFTFINDAKAVSVALINSINNIMFNIMFNLSTIHHSVEDGA